MDEIKIGKKMLTAEQVQSYNSDGYLLIPNVFSKEEIRECVQETDAMFERLQMDGGKLEATWGGKWQERQIEQCMIIAEETGRASCDMGEHYE